VETCPTDGFLVIAKQRKVFSPLANNREIRASYAWLHSFDCGVQQHWERCGKPCCVHPVAPAAVDFCAVHHHYRHVFPAAIRAGRPVHRGESGAQGDPAQPRGALRPQPAALSPIFLLPGRLGARRSRPFVQNSNRTVNEILAEKLPVSLELGLWSLAVALLLGLTLGMIAALRRNTWADYLASAVGMIGLSVPSFVIGPLCVLAFAIHAGWFNASGWYFPTDRVLPSLVLGLAYAAPISRLTRGGMLEVLNQDYIRTARAKGGLRNCASCSNTPCAVDSCRWFPTSARPSPAS